MNRTIVVLVGLIGLCAQAATHAASTAPVAAENGMVVTAQHLATRVGVDVLKRGGNAVDAAVAVGYALAVRLPRRRQPRRRRLHDDPARRRPQDLHRLSRDRAARRNGRHVSRREWQRHPRSQHPRPSRGRRAGHGLGPRIRAREVRHDAARRADRAGDRARRAGASCSTRATSTCCTKRPRTFARTRRPRRSS